MRIFGLTLCLLLAGKVSAQTYVLRSVAECDSLLRALPAQEVLLRTAVNQVRLEWLHPEQGHPGPGKVSAFICQIPHWECRYQARLTPYVHAQGDTCRVGVQAVAQTPCGGQADDPHRLFGETALKLSDARHDVIKVYVPAVNCLYVKPEPVVPMELD